MLDLILMLIALAFGNTSANTQSCNDDNNGTVTVQTTNPGTGTPGTGTDPGTGGSGGDTGGETIPLPPKK
ncbi:hypothetical protein [uncultured Chryseobacterium sp.]|uniref:hypothetical protein n=1 Tax=uncultured Chryseobacterium sp. TaxID=259322 RepID=UPI0025E51EF2|nr:hypothetical protein [uncultured Chryseobacterium sp.]